MTELAKALTPQPAYDLASRYQAASGPVVLTGVQAIARLLVEQHEADAAAGKNIATFVSGYQGSPLGGVDRMLGEMPDVLARHQIHFVPGLNEELAATAVWGSQTELPLGEQTHDGVVGVWYGKGPGVDRASDALRHANIYGTNPKGGILLLAGDDPASKSSTVPAVSERSLAALHIPVLFPRNAAEIVTLGRHAIEMSRVSGCVVALKIVADVADGLWRLDDSELRVSSQAPTTEWSGRPYVYRQRPFTVRADAILAAEAELVNPRLNLVTEYAQLNGLDVIDIDGPRASTGFVAAGTTYDSLRQAFLDLGISDDALAAAGIRVLRLGLIHPVDPRTIHRFAEGLDEIIVVEDKTAFIESQIKEVLYGSPAAPRILGKQGRDGRNLMPNDGELSPGRLLNPVRHLLQGLVDIRVAPPARIDLPMLETPRAPYFCSGCPHNRSTAVPEGSMAGGGIGCHIMVTTSGRDDSAVTGITQMGGEGAQWIGQAPFTTAPHLFQNIGDGTFFHSGQLALQACVAANVSITYKLLYNEVVAMTGAQDAEGALTVPQLTHKLMAEGVQRIIICAEEPGRHRKRSLASGTLLWHRDRLDEAQRVLREIPGVTVLIYDQHCAADARRQRKRGTLPPRTTRVIINEAVCEGCGDCGVKSNCLSVQPVETEFGRKTRIDQTSCNTDYSCLDGDCPSFITVEEPSGSTAKRPAPTPPQVSDPVTRSLAETHDVFMAGIGGTGIVTVNQVLAMAAMRAGLEVHGLDQTGMSQKAGPVTSHLRFSRKAIEPSNRLTPGHADCILAFDLLAASNTPNLQYGDPGRTVTVASTSRTPTGDMVYDPTVTHPDEDQLLDRLSQASRELHHVDALAAATALFGSTAAANFLVVGAAYQAGALGLPADSVEEAIGINGVAVSTNVAAFRWGKIAIADPEAFARATAGLDKPQVPDLTLEEIAPSDIAGEVRRLVEVRAPDLVRYQNITLARDYVREVERVWAAEHTACAGSTFFTEAVARSLYKLTAYKDEYEVAGLLTSSAAVTAAQREVPGATKLTFKLHPPALRRLGLSKKVGFGPRSHLALRLLARGKSLRGTALDPFGHAHVRKVERALHRHFVEQVHALTDELTPANLARAIEVATAPDLVRGYEHVKLRNVRAYLVRLEELGVDVGSLTALVGEE